MGEVGLQVVHLSNLMEEKGAEAEQVYRGASRLGLSDFWRRSRSSCSIPVHIFKKPLQTKSTADHAHQGAVAGKRSGFALCQIPLVCRGIIDVHQACDPRRHLWQGLARLARLTVLEGESARCDEIECSET